MRKENLKLPTKIFLFTLLLSHLSVLCSSSSITWDYNKGGEDWTGECKKEGAPIDIAQPFEFKSKV